MRGEKWWTEVVELLGWILIMIWPIIYVGVLSAGGVYIILHKLLVWLSGWKYDFEQPWWFNPSIIIVSIVIAVLGWHLIIKHDRRKYPRQQRE